MKCGKPLVNEEEEFCRDCGRYEYAYEQGRSLWVHSKQVAHAIYQFKFHNKRYYAGIFAEEMAREYGEWVRQTKAEVIIPVPLHKSKQKKRGFNQAELVAERLGEELGIPMDKTVVFRIRKTKPQKKLGNRARQSNLKGAFGVSKAWKPVKSVLLVDDIYTTGSTIHHIAKILKQAGVQKVYFLTISIGQGL